MKENYHAFISYGYDTDGVFAEALQNGLQRMAKPWHKPTALDVFRDATGMSANPDLLGELKKALARSRYLVLLASPDSAQSPWVNNEIRDFLAKDADAWQRVLVVVTDGVWQWAGDGTYTADSSAVPEALVGVFKAEILYVDLRWARGRTDLTLAIPQFKMAVADIAAPIHGTTEEELIGEDARQFRLAKRLRLSAVAGLSVLLVASLIASAVAVGNGREAVRQRNAAQEQTVQARVAKATAIVERDNAEKAQAEAEENAAIARSGELAASALAMKDDDPEVAALLAVEALYPNGETEPRHSASSDNAIGVTSRAVLSRLFAPRWSLQELTEGFTVAAVGDFVATVGPGASGDCWPTFVDGVGVSSAITWWDRRDGRRLDGVPDGVELAKSVVEVGSNILRINDARSVTPIVGAPELLTGQLPVSEPCSDSGRSVLSMPAAYDPTSDTIIGFDEVLGGFAVADAASGVIGARMGRLGTTAWADVAVGYAPNGVGLVFAADYDGKVSIWSLAGGGLLPADAEYAPFIGTWLAAAGTWLASSQGAVNLAPASGFSLSLIGVNGGFSFVTDVAFSEGQRYLAETDGTTVKIWELSGSTVVPVATLPSNSVRSIVWFGDELAVSSARGVELYVAGEQPSINDVSLAALSADGSVLVTLGVGGMVSVFDATAPFGEPVGQFMIGETYASAMALSPDGRFLMIRNIDLVVFDLASGGEVLRRPNSVGAFDPSGRRVAVVSQPAYDDTGTIVGLLAQPSEDAAGVDSVEIVTTDGWATLEQFPLAESNYGLERVEWLNDERLLISRYDESVRLVQLGETMTSADPPLFGSSRGGVWVAQGGTLVAKADITGRLELWELVDGAWATEPSDTVVAGTAAVEGVAFSADRSQMVTLSGTAITLWAIDDPANVRRVESLGLLPTLLALGSTIDIYGYGYGQRAWFTPDGKWIYVAVGSTVRRLPNINPDAVCEAIQDQVVLDRAEAIIGDESACTRIATLPAAG